MQLKEIPGTCCQHGKEISCLLPSLNDNLTIWSSLTNFLSSLLLDVSKVAEHGVNIIFIIINFPQIFHGLVNFWRTDYNFYVVIVVTMKNHTLRWLNLVVWRRSRLHLYFSSLVRLWNSFFPLLCVVQLRIQHIAGLQGHSLFP